MEENNDLPQSSFVPDTSGTKDELATDEAKAIGDRSLQKDADSQEHGRHQKFRNHINHATLIIFWSVVVCLVVSIFIFSYHMLTPETWHFLSQSQVDTLKTVLSGAILSSAMSGYVNSRMKA